MLLRHIVAGFISLLLAATPVAAADAAKAPQLHRIGVLALRGKPATTAAYAATADYLGKALPGHQFEIRPLDLAELADAVARRQVDFVLTNPENYIVLEARHRVTRIATVVQISDRVPLQEFGGVIVTRADRRDLKDLPDLRGKTVAAVAPTAFGGYLMQAGEMMEAGIDVSRDAKLLFLGLPQDTIVEAVAGGRADAGLVRTGVLESMARSGKIRLDDFRVLNRRQEGSFPFLLSTPLYPEWPFAAMPDTPEDLSKQVLIALLAMPPGSEPARQGGYHSWAIPLSYERVHLLMRTLRIAPYDAPAHFDLRDVLRKYEAESFMLLAAALLASMLVAVRFQRLTRRLVERNSLVAERGEALEREVATRKAAEHRLAAENEVLELLAVATPLPALLQHLVKIYGADNPGDPVAILLYDDAAQRFQPGAKANVDDALARAIEDQAPSLLTESVAGGGNSNEMAEGGSARNFRVEPIRAPAGRLLGCLVTRKAALANIGERDFVRNLASLAALSIEQAELAHRLRLNASVFANALEGILVTDPAGTIIDVNEAFTTLTGYAREEVIGQNPRLLKSGLHDAGFYDVFWQSLLRDGRWRGEIWNRRKDGRIAAEILNVSGVRDTTGRTTHFVGTFSDITDLKETQQRLEQAATHDSLTGLPNRTLLSDRLRQAHSHTQRRGTMLAVCFLDLDEFKPVNDSLGHAVGDRLLKEVATRLERALRAGDTVARLGGDEFVLLLLDLRSRTEAAQALDRLLADLASPYAVNDHTIRISASIGVTLFPDDDDEPDALLRHADQAMYQAKQGGRNRFHMFDIAENERMQGTVLLQQQLRAALEGGEFRLHYQPQVDMRNGRVVGVEALLRWEHPEKGLLAPGAFLAAIEQHDLICEIGEWVMAEALHQRRLWASQGLPLAVSVNIASHHFLKPDFVARLDKLLVGHPQLPVGALELEIVETAAFADLGAMVAGIRGCRDLGVRFALDNFGTGHSSLSNLRQLPADVLKIDRSFIMEMLLDRESLAIVEGIISLARAFERELVAEGVETAEHGTILLRMGCTLAQGYAIARPMPGDAVAAWAAGFSLPQEWRVWSGVSWEPEDFPLLAAEVTHRQWVETIIAAITSQALPEQEIAGLDRCSFGDWLDRHGRPRYGRQREYPAIESRHRDVHRIADYIVDMLDAGDSAEAHKLVRPLREASDRLLAALAALQRGASPSRTPPA